MTLGMNAAILASSGDPETVVNPPTPPPTAGWPDVFMSYPLQSGGIFYDGVDNLVIENMSFEDVYRSDSVGRPIHLANCNNATIRRIDTRGCTMGLIYAYNCTNLTIEYCRVENIAKEFIGQTLDWGLSGTPGYFMNENDCNLYQLHNCSGIMTSFVKGRYGNTEDAFSHFGCVDVAFTNCEWEGTDNFSSPTSDGQPSVAWSSDSGTGVIMGDGAGNNQLVENSSFINPGQVGIAIAGGNGCTSDNNVVIQDQTNVPANVGAYVLNYYGPACFGHAVTNTRINYLSNHWYDGGVCGAVDTSGSVFGDSSLNIEDYRVIL